MTSVFNLVQINAFIVYPERKLRKDDPNTDTFLLALEDKVRDILKIAIDKAIHTNQRSVSIEPDVVVDIRGAWKLRSSISRIFDKMDKPRNLWLGRSAEAHCILLVINEINLNFNNFTINKPKASGTIKPVKWEEWEKFADSDDPV